MSDQELSVDDAQKRRIALTELLAQYKSPREICQSLNITTAQFNRLLRETPGLADEVHAVVNAMHVGLRGRVVKMREEVLEHGKDEFARLQAGNDIDKASGVSYTRENGFPQIVIMGRDVTATVQTAKARDLEEIMRAAAERCGMPEVAKYVEAKITGVAETKGEKIE